MNRIGGRRSHVQRFDSLDAAAWVSWWRAGEDGIGNFREASWIFVPEVQYLGVRKRRVHVEL